MVNGARKHADEIPLRGGHLVLDFLNTAGWHASDTPDEWLTSYDELARWARHAGLHSTAEAVRLQARASESARDARRVFLRVMHFREALYRVCRGFIGARHAGADDLAFVQRAYADAVEHARLTQTKTGYAMEWASERDPLEAPLWRLSSAAFDFLSSGELLHTRECAGAPCGWLFLDRSRNRSRRWCASEECGNRERARRHRARQ